MPYTLIHDGLMREFDFWAPEGWEYWVLDRWRNEQKVGLPLVIALHGGGQRPEELQEDWWFPEVWGLADDGTEPLVHEVSNQFFVLYPYGLSLVTLPDLVPLEVNGTTLDSSVASTVLPKPFRGWNTLFGGTWPDAKDVRFIQAAMDAMNARLRKQLLDVFGEIDAGFPWVVGPGGQVVDSPDLFDEERRFVFGYSQGAMLAYRMVERLESEFAAIWAMSGTCGGKLHSGSTPLDPDRDPVFNLPDPATGVHAVSLFAHHGDEDTTVPPGRVSAPDTDLQTPQSGSPQYGQLERAGLPVSFQDWLPAFLPLSTAMREFRDYNGLGQYVEFDAPGLGADGASVRVWSRPVSADWNANNPVVVRYRDVSMEHTGFTSNLGRYFQPLDV
jgi:hypothetical protein